MTSHCTLAVAFSAALCFFTTANAETVILDFDALPRGDQIQEGNTLFEDGFALTAILGDGFGARGGVFSFNTDPRQFFFAGLDFPADGNIFEFSRVDGRRFTIEEFQFGSVNLGGNDLIDLVGIRNGVETAAIRNLTDTTGGFQQPGNIPITQSGLLFGQIDTLRFIIAEQNISGNGIAFDNFVVSVAPVPVPPGLVALASGLALLGLRRRLDRVCV
ncbi:MAG: hypothetical protein AAGF71_04455 [Pseudomonadota bacterium]